MHNFKLTAQQRTQLLTDMRAKMKQQPDILGLAFKLHLASKAEIIEAAEKLGLDAASYGTPAGAIAPATSKPKPVQTQPIVKAQAVAEKQGWGELSGVEEKADGILQQPYTDLRGSLVGMVSEIEDLKAKLASRPVSNVVSMPVASAPSMDTPDVNEHVQQLEQTGNAKADKIFRGLKVDWDIPVYNDTRAPAVDPNYTPDRSIAHAFLSIARQSKPRNMFFFGPAGTGKTSMPRYFAGQTGRSFWPITLCDDTTVDDFIGGLQSQGGSTYWSDGVLIKAIRQPHAVILIDEVSRARPDVLAGLNGLLEDRQYVIPTTGEIIHFADGVQIILADNTNGRGDASGLYAGTKLMDSSLLDRCAIHLRFGYPPKTLESRVLHQRSGAPKAFCDKVVDFMAICRKAHDNGEAPTLSVSLRRSTALTGLIMDGLAPKDAVEITIGNMLESVDQETLNQLFNTHVNPDEWAALAKGETWTEPTEESDAEPRETPTEGDEDEMPFN